MLVDSSALSCYDNDAQFDLGMLSLAMVSVVEEKNSIKK